MSHHENLKYAIGGMDLSPVLPQEKLDSFGQLKRPNLKHCPKPNCLHVGQVIGMYEEALLIECTNSACEHSWLVCCGRQKSPIVTLSQFRKHKSNIHSSSSSRRQGPKQATPQSQTHLDTDIVEPPDIELRDDDNVHSSSQTYLFGQPSAEIEELLVDCKDGHDLGFSDKKNQRYFQETFNRKSDHSGGLIYLAMRSLKLHNFHPSESVTSLMGALSEKAALLQLRVARMAFNMTPKHTKLFLDIITEIYKLGVEGGYDVAIGNSQEKVPLQSVITASQSWQNRIPKSLNDIRSRFLEGDHAIVNNIPYPPIQTDVGEHSYSNPSDCIRDFLGHHQNRQPALISDNLLDHAVSFATVQHPSHSRRAMHMLLQFPNERKMFTCYVFWWSDDVEPNRQKTNRGSIWMLTMTIGTILEDGHNLNHTYPIAVGKKKDNHDLVFQKVEENMKELRRGQYFYVGSIKKKALIRFLDFAHLGDQPERRGLNYILLGRNKGTPRFGISGNHETLYPVLRACEACDEINLSRLRSEDKEALTMPFPACSKCMNWNIIKKSPLSFMDPPANYPMLPEEAGTSVYETSPYCRLLRVQTQEGKERQVLTPFRLTHDGFNGAVLLAHEGFTKLGWSQKMTSAYLKVEGLNDEFANRFWEYAINGYSLELCRRSVAAVGLEQQSERNKSVLNHAAEMPALYKCVPSPAVWSREGLDVADWANALMHLLCLGVIKTMVFKIQVWLKRTSRNTAFRRDNAKQLEAIVVMSIEWMNLLRFEGDALGGWVSENFLGFGRVMPWFYQNLASLEKETPIELPDDPKKWLKKHYIHWLDCRGLDSEGYVEELRDRVANYMAEDPPPEVLPVPECPVDKVERALMSLYKLMECVMATTVTDELVTRTEYAVRVFLSAYDALESTLQEKNNMDGEDDENYIFSCYNFGSLIDLPEMMRKYGPLRQLWEGNIRGEGFLRFAKPLMKAGLKLRWHYTLLRDLHITKAFDNILPQEKKQVSPVDLPDGLVDRKAQFQKYGSQLELLQLLRETRMKLKKPISVILVTNRASSVNVYAVVEDYHHVVHLAIMDATVEPQKKFGCYYYKVDAVSEEVLSWTQVAPEVNEIGYGMMLPLLDSTNAEESCLFSLISSNWKTLNPTTGLEELVDTMSATFN